MKFLLFQLLRTISKFTNMTFYQSIDSGSTDPFKCSECNKTCRQRSQLYIHQMEHIGKVPLRCKICKKEFSDSFTLERHHQKSLCQPQDTRRHICRICHRAYHCASTLALHQRIHFIPRPFACTLCTASFSTRRTLTRHFQAHNRWEIPRCFLCGLVFSQVSALHTHEFLLRCVYPHNCNICGQKFTLSAQLRQHKKRHKTMLHGPFRCGLCDKEFFLRRTLIVHWRRHMAGPTFSCYLCPKAFYLKTRLASHLRLHVFTDVSKEWRRKKKRDKMDIGDSPCRPPKLVPLYVNKSKISDDSYCSEVTPLKVITSSRKSPSDDTQGAPRIYRCIPSGKNNNIYVEVGAEGMPGLEPPRGKMGEKVSMTYQQVVSRVKEIVLKRSAKNTATDKEVEAASSNQPLFKCDICKKSFARNISLKVHQKSHRSSSISGSSNSTTVTSTNISTHEDPPKQNFGPFPYCNSSMKIIVACSRCGERNFKSLEELERHVCSELKAKNHTCNICGKHFKFRCRLTTHILKHQHVKPCRVPCL